jgi:hypothetical protein
MFSEQALTKENLIAFLKEKGLYEECGEWCQPRYVKQEQDKIKEKDEQPLVNRVFFWQGHYTRCCYESSGERFNDTLSWGYFVTNEDLLPFDYRDPARMDYKPDPKMNIKLRDCENFDLLCDKLLSFVNGDLKEDVDRCYDFDKFGFDNPQTEDMLREWLGNLEVSEETAKDPDNKEWLECFEGNGF